MYLIMSYSLSLSSKLKDAENMVTQIQSDILMLRRAEKDFLLRRDLSYQDKFNHTKSELSEHISSLSEILDTQSIDMSELNQLSRFLEDYFESFDNLVAEYEKVGLDEKSGLQGALRKSVHNIESRLKSYSEVQLTKDMLMLRRREKDFLLRMDLKYLNKFDKDILVFQQNLQDSQLLSSSEKSEIHLLLISYQNAFHQMVKGYETLGLSSEQGAQGSMRAAIHQTDETLEQMVKHLKQTLDEKISSVLTFASIIALFFTILALVISRLTSSRISQAVNSICELISKVDKTKDFSLRSSYQHKDEILIVSNGLNSLLESIQNAINESNRVVEAIAHGKFDDRIQIPMQGDLDLLKKGVNDSAESVDFMMSELSKVMVALYNGQFDVKMDSCVPQTFSHKVETALESLNQTFTQITNVMQYMNEGNFQHRIQLEAKGAVAALVKSINNSIADLDSAMSEITRVVVSQSNGDLSQQIQNDYLGELKVLTGAVNNSSAKLSDVVFKAVTASNIVLKNATEVSDGAHSLSQRVQQQAAALEETSATMEEMNATVQNNTQNAKQASEVADKLQLKAEESSSVMHKTIQAMMNIQESSQKISEIVTLIDSIAFQTNLLALNAAVEAARAGEHGRGFAVVAGEVRSLAQKSAEAAKQISELINESVNRIENGTKLAEKSGDSLNAMTQAIEEMTGMIQQISHASLEQAEGVKQIHHAIADIDQVTQQNAALVEETTAVSESMNHQAGILSEDMAFFKTKENADHKLSNNKTISMESHKNL